MAAVSTCAVLFAADCQAVNAERGCRHRPAELEVAGDFGDVEEHLFEISRNRDLFHWKSELSILNPEARCASGIITSDEVGSAAEKFSDVEALLDSGDHVFRALWARL